MHRRKGVYNFEVPINYPDAHKLSLWDLIAAAELSGLITVFTPHNKKSTKVKEDTVSKEAVEQARKAVVGQIETSINARGHERAKRFVDFSKGKA